jgi:glutathione reductase (NADPH)
MAGTNPEYTFDWQQFIAAKEQEIHRLSQVHNQKLEKAGVALIKGKATFIDAHTLDVAGRKLLLTKF